MTAPIMTGEWPEFMNKMVNEVIKVGLDELAETADYKLFMEDKGSASLVTERVQSIEPMGLMGRWYENSDRPQVAIHPGYAHQITQREFGSEIRVTKKMEHFQQFDVVGEASRQMKMQPDWTLNVLWHNYLAVGDVATASQAVVNGIPIIQSDCPDGNPYFDTAHTFRSGGATYSNHTTGTTTPSEAALNTINVALRRWQNPRGLPLNAKIESALVPPDLDMTFQHTLNSRLDPLTANNRVNIASSLVSGGHKVLPYLESTTEWFLKTNITMNALPFYKWGWKPQVSQRGPETDSASNRAICLDMCVGDAAGLHGHGLYKVG